ncbi:MAG: pgl 1 [Phycisphaerales bacterium]|jgi:6-phosphogluconolactonase|nr:pgl 1 [Phycisphaerales bacterium]
MIPAHLFVLSAALLCVSASVECFAADAPAAPQTRTPQFERVYIGTYTGPKSKGIYLTQLDLVTGKLSEPQLAGETENPSWVTLTRDGRFLYAANESGAAIKDGAITAFSVGADGMLLALNQQPPGGGGPCEVNVDDAGKNLLVANYGSGAVALLPVGDDGKLSPPASIHQHAGAVADPKRQGGPHAHCIEIDPTGRFALSCDLGLDKVFVYKIDGDKHQLVLNDPPFGVLSPRSGPRHLAFHSGGRFAYVINEIALSVTAFSWDAQRGALAEIQSISTLPKDAPPGEGSTAEIAVHPSGKFLYGSNRGNDTIAVFTIDEQTGKLTAAGHTPSGGKTPRGFAIDPTGAFLVAGNQGSDNLVVFRIDQKTGALTPTGGTASLGAPVCVKFVTPGR